MKMERQAFKKLIYKVGLVSLGCAKNLVDSESILGLLEEKGFEIVNDSYAADIIIINTCGFIGPAKDESIDTILEYGKLKKSGICKLLILTGCLVQRYSNELREEIPEIDIMLGTGNYIEIVEAIELAMNGQKICKIDGLNSPLTELPRRLTTYSGSAYLKISDGCDNFCSFCIIPHLRGKSRSRSIESLIDEATKLAKTGVKEIILIGQDITRYGNDLNKKVTLISLLERLVQIPEIKWVRLLYLNPERVSKDLIEFIASNSKICRYLDIPIQHISDKILEKMNRNTSADQIKNLLLKVRSQIPGVVVRTSLIVGFPGETEAEFEHLVQFVKDSSFNHIGVFTYSQEEGTPAALFDNQIDDKIKELRRAKIMKVQKSISKKINKNRIDEICEVIIEGEESNNLYIARSYAEAPQVDGKIFIISSEALKKGELIHVKISKSFEYDLLAEKYEFSE